MLTLTERDSRSCTSGDAADGSATRKKSSIRKMSDSGGRKLMTTPLRSLAKK